MTKLISPGEPLLDDPDQQRLADDLEAMRKPSVAEKDAIMLQQQLGYEQASRRTQD